MCVVSSHLYKNWYQRGVKVKDPLRRMSEVAIIPDKPTSGGGPSSIQCPMLNSSNYMYRAMRIRSTLDVHKVWDTIEASSNDEEKNDDTASTLLLQSIPESLALKIGELNSAKKAWDYIKTKHVGAERVKEARLQTLRAEFVRVKMKTSETIN